ncbi:MAG: TonB family protein [Alishewanella aestuarii]
MINWLWQANIWLSILSVLLLSLHPLLLKWCGARTLYSLWLLLPVALLLPLVPALPAQSPANLLPEFWLVLPDEPGFVPQANAVTFVVLLLWATGTLLVFGYALLSQLRLQRQLNAGRHYRSGTLVCYRKDSALGPAIFGLLTPQLILPDNFLQRFDRDQRKLILQHERAHWQSADPQCNLLALILVALFWFNPLSWLAYRRYRADQELACDARVLQQQDNTTLVCYARTLLAAMQSAPPTVNLNLITQHYGALATMTERLTQLKQRRPLLKYPALSCALALLCAASLLQTTVAVTESQTTAAQTKTEITPIVRINPRYPVKAAAEGINGWVQLSFNIDAQGKVENLRVLDANPRAVFNDEALQAVAKWRYHPDHAGSNLTIQLAFELDTDSR